MRILILSIILTVGALSVHAQAPTPSEQENAEAPAPPEGGGAPVISSNALNPNISLVGNFLAFAGDDPETFAIGGGDGVRLNAFELSEAELGLQSVIDPYAKADVFVAFNSEGAELEEAYVTWLKLPTGVGMKVGKFRSAFGKLNPTHPPETHYPDRPLVHEAFFGEEGLAGTGVHADYTLPTRHYFKFIVEATNTWEEAPAFGFIDDAGTPADPADDTLATGGRRRGDLGWLGRAETYFDLSDSQNLFVGASYATASWDAEGSLRSNAAGADVTYRWKNPKRSVYRSVFWQTEVMRLERQFDGAPDTVSHGGFTHINFQFARRWNVGARADYAEAAFKAVSGGFDGTARGGMLYAAYKTSEFSLLGLYGRSVRLPDGTNDFTATFRLTFSLGPHGAHPF